MNARPHPLPTAKPIPAVMIGAAEPAPWYEILADSWDRIANTLEAAPSGSARASILPQPKSEEHAKAVATAVHALAESLRIAGQRQDR